MEIVFEAKDLTDEYIEEIIRQYTESDFTVVKVENNGPGAVKIIVEFVDHVGAEEFVRTIKTSSSANNIKRVGLNYEPTYISLSSVCFPLPLLIFLWQKYKIA